VNADGIDDLIISGTDAGPYNPPFYTVGRACLLYGHQSAFPPEIELTKLLPRNGGDGSVGVVFEGIDGGDYTGFSISGAADVNGDDINDLLIGAPQGFDPYDGFFMPGRAYVVFGRPAGRPQVEILHQRRGRRLQRRRSREFRRPAQDEDVLLLSAGTERHARLVRSAAAIVVSRVEEARAHLTTSVASPAHIAMRY
jgi:hypothetical protein